MKNQQVLLSLFIQPLVSVILYLHYVLNQMNNVILA